MWLGRGELPFSFVGQESTCDWWNTWTWSKHLFFFNRGWYECVYRKSWPGPPLSCPRPALLLLEEINPGVESRDKKKKKKELPSHVPNITFCPRVNYMATMKSSTPAFSHYFHYWNSCKATHETFELNYSFQASPKLRLQWARQAISSQMKAQLYPLSYI